ncbi:MAG: hypothetical protein LBV69_01005, partial [Bacteroidales bacterium]|nr:hypothetical protein [Bacteroidales bacterium]
FKNIEFLQYFYIFLIYNIDMRTDLIGKEPKKYANFKLKESVVKMIIELAEANKTSQACVIEQLVEEAYKK